MMKNIKKQYIFFTYCLLVISHVFCIIIMACLRKTALSTAALPDWIKYV